MIGIVRDISGMVVCCVHILTLFITGGRAVCMGEREFYTASFCRLQGAICQQQLMGGDVIRYFG